MSSRPKGHGYAALAREDVADAKRGRPPADLEGYARAGQLEWLDRRSPAGFHAAVPTFEEYRFNMIRGQLAGGRFGVLFHQLLEVPVIGRSPSLDGKLFAVAAKSPGGPWWIPSLPNRTDIPFIGNFLDPPTDNRPAEAFDSQAVWIPTTTAAVNVPESVLPLCLVRIDRRRHHAPFDFAHRRSLDEFGLPGWHLRAQHSEPPNALLARLLCGPVIDLFRGRADDPFFQLLLLRGTLLVRRNGYLLDTSALDRLASDASLLAEATRAACLPEAHPRRFEESLPAPHSDNAEVTLGWAEGYRKLAERLGLTLEDPDDYHRAFPSLGVPGRAVAVMRGRMPGTQLTGRLVYHAERALGRSERARGAVLLPASPHAEATPEGGVRVPERQLVYELRDDVVVLWSMRTAGLLREEQDDLIARAVGLARERGLGS
jgi:hypothetical protein